MASQRDEKQSMGDCCILHTDDKKEQLVVALENTLGFQKTPGLDERCNRDKDIFMQETSIINCQGESFEVGQWIGSIELLSTSQPTTNIELLVGAFNKKTSTFCGFFF